MVSQGTDTPPAVKLSDFGTSISPLNPTSPLWQKAVEKAKTDHTLHPYCSPEYETPEMAGLTLWNMKRNRLNSRLTKQLRIPTPPEDRLLMLKTAAKALGRGSKGAMNPKMTDATLASNLGHYYEKQDVYVTGCLLYEILTGDSAPPNLAQLREDCGDIPQKMLNKSINYTIDDKDPKSEGALTYKQVMLNRMQERGVPEEQALAVVSMMDWNPLTRPTISDISSTFNPGDV